MSGRLLAQYAHAPEPHETGKLLIQACCPGGLVALFDRSRLGANSLLAYMRNSMFQALSRVQRPLEASGAAVKDALHLDDPCIIVPDPRTSYT